jgi:guanine deaminase
VRFIGPGSAPYTTPAQDQTRHVGFDDEFIYKEIALPLEQRKIRAIRIVDARSDLVFKEWANSPEKKRY